MKLAVVFPSVMYREGPDGVQRLIQGIETLGYDELDLFDHVVMGHPTERRRAAIYSATMPLLEPFMTLAHAAALTTKIKLGTSVLILPQRQPALVAKQVATLDELSGGRVRLGVGSGWQRSEYEALEEDFGSRGTRLDEAIQLLRRYWSEEPVEHAGDHYVANAMAMNPKPPQGGQIPIWIGGTKAPALRRVAKFGDGWMAMDAPGDAPLIERIEQLRRYADELDRDFDSIGMQMSLSPGAIDKTKRKRFYADLQLLAARAAELASLGFDHVSLDCVPLFQLGHRTSEQLLEQLGLIHDCLRQELDLQPGA